MAGFASPESRIRCVWQHPLSFSNLVVHVRREPPLFSATSAHQPLDGGYTREAAIRPNKNPAGTHNQSEEPVSAFANIWRRTEPRDWIAQNPLTYLVRLSLLIDRGQTQPIFANNLRRYT